MKKLTVLLTVLLVLVVMFSIVPPASASEASVSVQPAGTKYVWISIRNQTNRYVTLNLDHQTILAIYHRRFAPGSTDVYLPAGRYSFELYACGRYSSGTFDVKNGRVWKISCPKI